MCGRSRVFWRESAAAAAPDDFGRLGRSNPLITYVVEFDVEPIVTEVDHELLSRAPSADVPGGSLYYEVRGSGPLLSWSVSPWLSAAFAPLADLLAEVYTVVTYDPHGLGESTIDDPSLPVTPEIEADDLAHIVDFASRREGRCVRDQSARRSLGWPSSLAVPRRSAHSSRTSGRSRICCGRTTRAQGGGRRTRTPIGRTGLARRGASSPPS